MKRQSDASCLSEIKEYRVAGGCSFVSNVGERHAARRYPCSRILAFDVARDRRQGPLDDSGTSEEATHLVLFLALRNPNSLSDRPPILLFSYPQCKRQGDLLARPPIATDPRLG
jgi:hypothetical protein